MFQPQPTPYAPFSPYGAQNEQDHAGQTSYNYQSTAGLGALSGGPIVFDNPVFSPIGSFRALNIRPGQYSDAMATPPNDLEAQESLARSYQPDIDVR
jgi:hypothetical protein